MLVGERRATILENVRLARPDATDDEIRGAMRLARLEDWVDSLPDGWNTFVGEAGILRLRRGTTAHRPGAGVPRRVTRDRARRANGSCGSDVDPHVVP